MAAESAKPQRIHQAIARQIGIAILSGEYPPGHGFEGEIEEAHSLEVSRTAYREALRILVSKGLLTSRPKAGTQVTPRERWNLVDPDVLAWMFSGRPDESFIRDLFELRKMLEPPAAALAAQRRTPEQVAGMANALTEMANHGLHTSEGQEADQTFHRLILAASGNEAVASLSSSIAAAVRWTTQFKQRGVKRPRDPQAEHEAVYAAIAAGDKQQAHATMLQLIEQALEDMADTP